MISSLILCASTHIASAAITIDFEDLNAYTDSGRSYYNGDSGSGPNSNGWTSGGVFFSNTYSFDPVYNYSSWSGWSYSNVNNPNTAGYGNQYASAAGTGIGGSGNYALAYGDSFHDAPYFNLPTDQRIESLWISNTTYTYFSMKNGDIFAKKFGGASGQDPDFFKVTFTGYQGLGATGQTTGTADFYLADYRNVNNAPDYIVEDWRWVDLSSLGVARSVSLSFAGSDVTYTPTYAAFDNITLSAVPEPSIFALPGCLAIVLMLRRSRPKRISA